MQLVMLLRKLKKYSVTKTLMLRCARTGGSFYKSSLDEELHSSDYMFSIVNMLAKVMMNEVLRRGEMLAERGVCGKDWTKRGLRLLREKRKERPHCCAPTQGLWWPV